MKFIATLFASLCLTAWSFAAAPSRPNIVFILADDLGWSDTTLYGTTKLYQTPNLERLAKRGMLFTRAYSASPLCSPTRASILTGQNPARIGITAPTCHVPQELLRATVRDIGPAQAKATVVESATRFDTQHVTLAERLKDAGYATGHFGKWHLGPEPYSPLQHGFDVDIPHHAGPGPAGSFVAPWKFRDFKERSPAEHIEDRMGDEAVAFIEANKDRPFFLNYWQFSVHAPFDAKKELIEKYRPLIDPQSPQRSPTYAAMVQSLDENVGKLLDALDRLGLAEKTAIVFFSDNGGNMYNVVDGTTPTSNAPLRGGKATMFEGGVRVPAIVSWPGVTKSGVKSDQLIQSTDFYPTTLALLGLPATPNHPLDGRDVTAALRGDDFDRGPIFTYFPHQPGVPDNLPPSVSVHRGDWKLIRLFHEGENGAHAYHLYDLKGDLGERTNLAQEKPEIVRELDGLITTFLADTGAVLPKRNPKYDPNAPVAQAGKGKARTARVGAWTHSKDTELTQADGALHLIATGGDPWIATTHLPKAARGPFSVTLRMKSTGRGAGLVYFSTRTKPGFNKVQTVGFPLVHDGEFHDYAIRLPIEDLTALRLDPGNAKGELTVANLELRDVTGQVVKTWIPATAASDTPPFP